MTVAESGLFAMILGLIVSAPWRDPDKDSLSRLLVRLIGLVILLIGEAVVLNVVVKVW